MTTAQLTRLVYEWQHKLGLERYIIEVQWDRVPEEDGFYDGSTAEIATHKTYDIAKVRFAPDATLWDEEKATVTIIHELLHVLHNPICRAVDSITAELPARNQADAWYLATLETFIERLARRIYEVAR